MQISNTLLYTQCTSIDQTSGYEWTRAFFERAALKSNRVSSRLTTVESMIAGAIAGSATVLITNPIWVVNTRMTARQSASASDLPGSKPAKKPSTIATVLSLFREEGPTALFAGVLPALVLVINPILQYTIFEQLKNTLEKRRRLMPRDAFALGAIGKLLATSITYPYITVKSRMHVASKEGPQGGMASSVRRIVREEGWAGLYKGEFSTSLLFGVEWKMGWLTPVQALDQRSRRALSQQHSYLPSRMRSMI